MAQLPKRLCQVGVGEGMGDADAQLAARFGLGIDAGAEILEEGEDLAAVVKDAAADGREPRQGIG